VTTDPRELTDLAGTVATDVGREIARRRADGVARVATKSTPTDMVTEFDGAAERMILAALEAARPDDGYLGEEGAARPGSSGVSWLIDPIDGTTNLLYDLPGWAVSIAACTEAGPVAGAVFVPATDELFSAALGHGAHLNGRSIRCRAHTDVATALVGTGFAYQPATRAEQGLLVAALLPRVRDIRRYGSAAVDLCSVAAGRLDVYVEEALNPWDLAAGEIIAREAGATVTDLDGGPVRPESVLACSPGLHGAFVELLAEVRAR
jgi:fructose-1,6-bisphosphatase/inositol monophosphatase family enzyme